MDEKAYGCRVLCLIKEFSNNYRQQCTSSRILFYVFVENANRIQHWGNLGNKREISDFVSSQENRELYDIAGEPVGRTTTQLHFEKDGGQSQHALRNMEAQLIQKVFTTSHNQVQGLQKGRFVLFAGPAGYDRKHMNMVYIA